MLANAVKIVLRLGIFLLIFTLVVSIIPSLVFSLPDISFITTPIKKVLNILLYFIPGFGVVIPLILVKISLAAASRGNRVVLVFYNWLLGITR